MENEVMKKSILVMTEEELNEAIDKLKVGESINVVISEKRERGE